jgi:hypothetical protein
LIIRTFCVTTTVVVSTPSEVVDRYSQRIPGRRGKYGLSTVALNAAGSISGAYGPVTGAAEPAGTGPLRLVGVVAVGPAVAPPSSPSSQATDVDMTTAAVATVHRVMVHFVLIEALLHRDPGMRRLKQR